MRVARKIANIEKTDVRPEACGASFQTKNGCKALICFPSLQHTAFYFPPTSSTDRAVNIIEIKDFIILWTYSQ